MIREQHLMSPQEIANTVYSYHKSQRNSEVLQELKPGVRSLLHRMIPVELCQVLQAYCECGYMDDALLSALELEFKGRFEAMNPSDISTFYYYFTKEGFKGSGRFYKYLQKATTKTLRAFEGPHIRMMLFQISDPANRLNRGVRGRLLSHCSYLLRSK